MPALFNLRDLFGQINVWNFAEASRRLGISSLTDAAADGAPVENLSRFTKLAFSLVLISSGKAMCGPQRAGFLIGRQDLVEAAKLNTCPHSDSIDRGRKVGKEEIPGALLALERYLKRDHAADWKQWERSIGVIAAALKSINSVGVETYVPPIASHLRHARVRWSPDRVRQTVEEVKKELREGDPSIEARPDSKGELILRVWTPLRGEDQVVWSRLAAILERREFIAGV
jgi:seryl-tRNA(Sec) selenium transferase